MRKLFYYVYHNAVQSGAIEDLSGVENEASFQPHFDKMQSYDPNFRKYDEVYPISVYVNNIEVEPDFFNQDNDEEQDEYFTTPNQRSGIRPSEQVFARAFTDFPKIAGVLSKTLALGTKNSTVKLNKIELNTTADANIEYREFCTVSHNNTSSRFIQSIVISKTQYKLLLTPNNKAQNTHKITVAVPPKQPSWSLFSFFAYLCSCFGLFRCCWPSHQKRPDTPRPPRETKGQFFADPSADAPTPTRTNSRSEESSTNSSLM